MITAIRSVFFYIGYVMALLLVSCIIMPLSLPLPQPARAWLILRYNWFVLLWLRITCGIRYEVEGVEHLPKPDQNVVILSNHQSEWETIYLQLVAQPMSTVLKQELLKIPFFGWGLRVLKPIAVDRSKPAAAMKQVLKQGKDRLEEGLSVLVFPEGTRTEPGSRGDHKKGGAMLAVNGKKMILPVAHNAGEHWTSSPLQKKSGTIKVVFGELIATEGRHVNEVHAEVTQWLETQVNRISAYPVPEVTAEQQTVEAKADISQ
ncbi:1-acyl-sn-glycerol-3-phosphate acyltransferase [Oceanospirillum multiglobuliferum]|uniref:1-acyl-sn-glycerol-3-phosphate acyltransferase n=1 Tax=Oceanospirillum multiglobuliferum TaxID=64969 RepID=A0A1T4RN46_9GAMM|nr:lysophospholipid acyltransferase family protein [Oceanospirillum multiglobuliferum]OPX54758.1 1-acyl-sn-glycerol-3-phosphate acyltransferase [Oceanospirillum multiglobuliferum]SKA17168.1 1-acyl-sn-glycerol-3-phosphate acyltransferase [Oceanospirillum multiglobuliferum]